MTDQIGKCIDAIVLIRSEMSFINGQGHELAAYFGKKRNRF